MSRSICTPWEYASERGDDAEEESTRCLPQGLVYYRTVARNVRGISPMENETDHVGRCRQEDAGRGLRDPRFV